VDRLKRRILAVPKAAKKAAEVQIVTEAHKLAGKMKGIVPVNKDPSPGRPGGALKDSITVTEGGQRTPSYSHPGGSHVVPEGAAEITAGNSKVRYAHLVEYGTKNAQSQPFFWPSVRVERPKIQRRINRAIRKAITEA
jgi:HK97 gp10 family phage protein